MSAPATATLTGAIDTSGETPIIPVDKNVVAHVPQQAEMVTHTHAMNSIDGAFYDRYYFLTALRWKATEAYGQVLYKLPLKPQNMWKNLRILSSMYYAWQGGFDISIQTAGTGFNGGKLAVVKTPPGIDLSEASEADWCHYPRIEMDPKELYPVDISTTDQRNTMFHWNFNTDDDRLGKLNEIGGTIWLIVYLPLITAQKDVDASVNLAVFAKCAADFAFSGLREAKSEGSNSTQQFRLFTQTGQNPSTYRENPVIANPSVKSLVIETSSTVNYGLVWDGAGPVANAISVAHAITTWSGGNCNITLSLAAPLVAPPSNRVSIAARQSNVVGYIICDLNDNNQKLQYVGPVPPTLNQTAYPNFDVVTFMPPKDFKPDYTFQAPNGEAVLIFNSEDDKDTFYTSRTMLGQWFEGWKDREREGYTPVFALKAIDGRTLAYMRLNKGLVFSTNMPTTKTIIPLTTIDPNMVYIGDYPINTVLPANPPALDVLSMQTKADELKQLLRAANVFTGGAEIV